MRIQILIVASIFALGTCNLEFDQLWNDFFQVAHGQEVVELLERKMAEQDPDMLRVAKYLKSMTFRAIEKHMLMCREFNELMKWLMDNGLPLKEMLEWVDHLINWEDFVPPPRSLMDLYEEIRAIVPMEDVFAWGIRELAIGSNMLPLVDRLQDNSTEVVVQHLYKSKEFLGTRCALIMEDFPIQHWETIVCTLLEWESCVYPTCGRESHASSV